MNASSFATSIFRSFGLVALASLLVATSGCGDDGDSPEEAVEAALESPEERAYGTFDPGEVRREGDQRAIQRVLDQVSELDPAEIVDVVVRIHFDGEPRPPLRDLEGSEREAVVAQTLASVHDQTEGLRALVHELGGEVLSIHWLVPSVVVRVPAGQVAEVLAHERVRNAALSLDEQTTN